MGSDDEKGRSLYHDTLVFLILKLANLCAYFWTELHLAHNDLKLENLLLDKDFNVATSITRYQFEYYS